MVETLLNVSQPLRKYSLRAVPGSFLYVYHVIFGKKAHLDLNTPEKVFTVKKKKVGSQFSPVNKMCRCSGTSRCARDKTDVHLEP